LKWYFPDLINDCSKEIMMPKVALVTDSTAYIPQDLVDQYQITVAPQVLIWGEETYKDGVDISPTEFYNRLATAAVMPTTSQVAVPTFQDIFERLHGEGKDILVVLLSEKLSKSLNSAELARQMVPDAKIMLVNSQTTAMELGFHVLEAARAAAGGATLAECKAIAEAAQEKSGVLFVVDTLEFLHRGGRIGGASRLVGTALQLKPVLEVRDGRVEPIENVRTKKKAHKRLIELVLERIKNKEGEVRVASLHANASDDAKALLEEISEKTGAVETVFSEVSPVVGTHCGPGTVGIAYIVG
jgi:DegV family protein with EDD domain